ncbi:hypothetical protein LXL04_006948 [Taraxacum kok-saghyz]
MPLNQGQGQGVNHHFSNVNEEAVKPELEDSREEMKSMHIDRNILPGNNEEEGLSYTANKNIVSDIFTDSSFKVFSDVLSNGGIIKVLCVPLGAKSFSNTALKKGEVLSEATKSGAKDHENRHDKVDTISINHKSTIGSIPNRLWASSVTLSKGLKTILPSNSYGFEGCSLVAWLLHATCCFFDHSDPQHRWERWVLSLLHDASTKPLTENMWSMQHYVDT